ncbi:unnamed protein product [Candidula unifasciata]|uniref:PHD-type domain-containing protein n=1 Tax=Candidula unifasciata TaxID=100452 RepID=A0A8S3YE78_9EUPU|nr:unnamed protein product [Candidula unifasciata]
MNHHYPDNYHGYGHTAPSMPNIGYNGGYGDQTAMARMVHPREGYQMSPYQLMQQSGAMYSQGGFMGQQSNNPYTMGSYGNYGMSAMNPSIMMGSRQGDLSRINGGNMGSPYYSPSMPSEAHTTPHHGGLSSQPSSYSHSQANPHMQPQQQQPPHMGIMQNQGHHSITNQPIHGQASQHAHSTGHSMPQGGPHQNSGGYASQSSPHMLPRAHHVPQHPMRHTTTQQNPQEVADNILQMASSYPSNQTVQVPLKSRPAPYHIPRSPHYSMSHGDHPHMSPTSPVASCQASPTPSSASVKSPTPVLVPIPNPIPSPGISGLRSPCNQGMSPCGTQRSPAHMGSTYSGHSQGGPPTQCSSDGLPLHHRMSPSDTLHYSPCGMAPVHSYSPFSVSGSVHRNSSVYSPSCDPNSISCSDLHQHSYTSPASSSPCSSNLSLTGASKHIMAQSTNSHPSVSFLHMDTNPLMSLQKLVMLPETQVIDPKSVVNDTCLSSQHDESPKNGNGPAERLAESSCHSVGFQGHTSSHRSHPQNNYQSFQPENTDAGTSVSSNYLCNSYSDSQAPRHSQYNVVNNYSHRGGSSRNTNPKQGGEAEPSDHEFGNHRVDFNVVEQSACDRSEEKIEETHTPQESAKQESTHLMLSQDENISADNPGLDAVCITDANVEAGDADKDSEMSVMPNILPLEDADINTVIGFRTEKAVEIDSQNSLYSKDRKIGKMKDDTKCLIVQCHSPSVLSEMPIVNNGLSSTTCGNDDDLEQDCGNGVHARIQNALNSLVKAKLASVKKMSQFAHVTPCSIAVGADERAACDRFAFRHNGFCRTLRTSNVVCSGRNRNDSTGNGDSDESLENLSENSFGFSESPQDGNRKKPAKAAKHIDHKKANMNNMTSTVKVGDGGSKRVEPVTSGSGECVSYGHEVVSDDDTCYYEGVDSSDIFINNCSSDESVASAGEVRHGSNSAKEAADATLEEPASLSIPSSASEVQEEEDKTNDEQDTKSPPESDKQSPVTEAVLSSPPPKRLRRSSEQKAQTKWDSSAGSRKSLAGSVNEEDDTIIDLTCDSIQVTTVSACIRPDQTAANSTMRSFRERNKNSTRFRPSILGHRQDGKYPVVVLEKSPIAGTPSAVVKQEKVDHCDPLESSSPLRDQKANAATPVSFKDLVTDKSENQEPEFKSENNDFVITFNNAENDKCIKMDCEEAVEENGVKPSSSFEAISHKNKMHKKKPSRRKAVKSKHKTKAPEKINRDTEVRDSFKSMKFSRTLDLIKSRKKREQQSVGPFIRVVGKQSTPDSVSVFVQPVHESSKGVGSGKHKHSKHRNAHLHSAATTVHMVTNLPTDKAAMISSSRTISNNPWVCAFCGHQSSYGFLGDLYGPYFKESEVPRVEMIAAEESKRTEPGRDQRISDSLGAKLSKETSPPDKRSSRKGKSPLQLRSSEPSPVPPEEVWVHEACAMWAPGVYLIDNKLFGLDEAVRDAEETVCSACKSKGAMIGCLHKGCCMKYHFICAIDKDCFMDEEKLSLLCPKHKVDLKMKKKKDLSFSLCLFSC